MLPFSPEDLALFAEEITPDMCVAQSPDPETPEICDGCGELLEGDECPSCDAPE